MDRSMDISMDIFMDISMDLFMDIHIHGNPGNTWQMMRKFPSRKRTKHVE